MRLIFPLPLPSFSSFFLLFFVLLGGSKRSFYHEDLWTLKYLPKFKWNHLTERIAFENASRAQRLRTEMDQAKRENKAYTMNVDRAKAVEAMEEKAKRRREKVS